MVITRVYLFIFLTFLLSILLCTPIFGQYKDAGLWTSVNFEARVVKKLSFNLAEEVRFNENITEAGVIFTDVGLSYKINKHFQIAGNYRFTQRRKTDDYYSFRHRFYVDFKYEKKIKPFQFQIRSRVQDEYADIGRALDGGVPEYYWRNKLTLKWDLDKPFMPYFSLELFSLLNYPRSYAFGGMRASAGVEYSLSKHHKLDAYYMIQKELNTSNPETDFVIGVGYAYKL